MDEYIVTITRRTNGNRLAESLLMEFSFDTTTPRPLIDGLSQLAEMMKLKRRPEALASFIRENEHLAGARFLTGEK